jgi:hypothetical protein
MEPILRRSRAMGKRRDSTDPAPVSQTRAKKSNRGLEITTKQREVRPHNQWYKSLNERHLAT